MADRKDDACEASNEIKRCVPGEEENNMKSLDSELFSVDTEHEAADVQSLDGIASAQPTPLKSDISTERSFEMDPGKAHGLNAAEDRLNVQGQDMQQRTESSCSNSLSTIPPVSLSNHSFQETSKEMCSFRNCVVSTDSSNAQGFGCKLEEPLTASSESGACQERSGNLDVSRVAERQISGETKGALTVKSKAEVNDKIKAESWAKEASEFSLTKPTKVVRETQNTHVAEFDLNEDINTHGSDDCDHQPAATVSSAQRVIQVVAKAGKPSGLPEIPLLFEGRLGWQGSAETSAFRRPPGRSRILETKLYPENKEAKDPQGFTGIDLNIAAVEENSASEMPVELGLNESKNRGLIDLNHLYDAADEFTQPSLQPESANPPSIDLNMNGNTSTGDRSNILHWPNVDHHSLGNNTSDSANPRARYINLIGQEYFANPHIPVAVPSILQPVELLQRAPPLQQPKLPFGPPTVNLASYPSNVPQHFISAGPLPSSIRVSGGVPYARYSHEHAIYPGLLHPGSVHASFCAPHLVQIVHEQGPGTIAATFPSLDARSDDIVSTGRIKMDEARQLGYIATNQETWCDPSMKRKEPEGGFRHYQLGYKHVT
ncbi:uncharacterized protein LOC127257226 [Andrographis paniculata]|uniref:uncharacterized protein LOC127257226 n=1 Tax=Andrographis paniculata TaxID=175694 RepID=UPI0021E7E8B1|nr:uncharacterized protein LOC127257226 [Andrographis paniculata]XP_051139567.1 uncharacterized protein LOC127257226 [Andrographis paniculata]XP_051139568.1 uncharacterized protein LOC127257226 [Andrographis paniculata]XP_051139569.1 uncharacterized protein LOC127257226 [Andrographis paniculata]XP_051139570.1 uncharacterized protein LOC127257226 [Andrographis paniculata]XP_051139571.1 uncharacterized protein LOC127257226 [Andrographis paniculata]